MGVAYVRFALSQHLTFRSAHVTANPPDCVLFVFNPVAPERFGGEAEEEALQRLTRLIPANRLVLVATHGLGIGGTYTKVRRAFDEPCSSAGFCPHL